MRKLFRFLFVILMFVALACGWILFSPATKFSSKKEFLYISSDAVTQQAVMDSLQSGNLIKNSWALRFLGSRLRYWDNIRPGRYEIEKGSNLLSIMRMLRNGQQSPVQWVITKLRTKEDLSKATGNRFEFDSLKMNSFLNDADTMQRYRADTASVLWPVLPDTYSIYWNSTPSAVYQKLYASHKKFWNEKRKGQAAALGLSEKEVTILASIIEEETTNHKEKDTIASVYLNRLKVGMPLQADPTLKFAVRNFALKRIAGDILKVVSPYNTYLFKGLPPGPICTPSKITIDAVLQPAKTPYFYFVANSRLNGHLFSTTFEEHVKKANAYREEDRSRQ